MDIQRESEVLPIMVNSDFSGNLVLCYKLPQKLVMQNNNHLIMLMDSVH